MFPYSLADILGRKKVELKIKGDINNFRIMTVEEFRQMLADKCGSSIIYIHVDDVKRGCVGIVFEVPASCADKIFEDASRNASWLINNDVLQVRVAGEEPIVLSRPASSLADINRHVLSRPATSLSYIERPEKGNDKDMQN